MGFVTPLPTPKVTLILYRGCIVNKEMKEVLKKQKPWNIRPLAQALKKRYNMGLLYKALKRKDVLLSDI